MAAPTVARLLIPDDANPAGSVHGGTTLRLMEEAGMIAATRYMSSSSEARGCIAALVRFDNMAFYKPIFVGEVASCTCEIIFTSKQSILVEVVVTAEDLSKGKTRVTNTGWLWYVPMVPTSDEKVWNVADALPLEKPTGADALKKFEKAKAKYDMRKNSSKAMEGSEDACSGEDFESFKNKYVESLEGHTPTESEQTLCQMVLPGDCGKGKIAYGGFVMKLMDNAAGCSAWRHCRTNIVTVAISDMDFVSWVTLGDICTIKSKVVFSSSKSLEIEVVASVASVASETEKVVARGLFTFVSIADGKVLSVPKLKLESDEDFEKAYAGMLRYETAKKARQAGSK